MYLTPPPLYLGVTLPASEEDPDEAVQAIIRSTKARIERNELSSNVVDVDTVSAVVADLTSREQDLTDSSTQMQSAFLRPRLYFDPVRNTLLLYVSGEIRCRILSRCVCSHHMLSVCWKLFREESGLGLVVGAC